MKINRCPRVCRFAVLALLIVVLGTRVTNADPLVLGSPGAACTGLVASTSLDICGLFALGEPAPTQTLNGSFTQDNDVALFQFILTGAAGVSAFTSGVDIHLDSLIGLFYGPGSLDPTGTDRSGNIVRYFNATEGADV